jgi:hypothetical protein
MKRPARRERIYDTPALVVTDPGYRGRLLVAHIGLSAVEIRELICVYHALGYPAHCLTVTTPARAMAA